MTEEIFSIRYHNMENEKGLQTRLGRILSSDADVIQKDSLDSTGNFYGKTSNKTSQNYGDLDKDNKRSVVVIVVATLLLISFVYLFRVTKYCRSDSGIADGSPTTPEQIISNNTNEIEQSVEERCIQIESSLDKILVREHDSKCYARKQNMCQTITIHDDESALESDTGFPIHRFFECPICLDPLRIGDIVSRTKSAKLSCCPHVFHHSCIKSWLLKNDTCPTCRANMMTRNEESKEIQLGSEASLEAKTIFNISLNAELFFCVSHGIGILEKETNTQDPITPIPSLK